MLFVALFVLALKFNKSLGIFSVVLLISVFAIDRIHVLKSIPYYVSQEEKAAALYLSTQEYGTVLVYDKECPWCFYTSDEKPAVYAGKMGWIHEYSRFPLIYNKAFFESTDLNEAKNNFKKLRPRYIFVDTYGMQDEKIPFSPGDYNIERVYKNAYVEIWKVI